MCGLSITPVCVRALHTMSRWSSRAFAVEMEPAGDPVYFTLLTPHLPASRTQHTDYLRLFHPRGCYSVHVCGADNVQRAMLYEELRSRLTSAVSGSTRVLDMFAFHPGLKGSVLKGFFLRGVSETAESQSLIDKLTATPELRVCAYARGHDTAWRQCLLSPGGGTNVETYSLVGLKPAAEHPSTLDIFNTSIFYSFQDAYSVLTQCLPVIPGAKQVLDVVDQQPRTKRVGRFPVIVIEGLDATGKTTLTHSLNESLGGTLLRSPPPCLSPWRACFDSKPPLIRRAFYALGNYITAGHIAEVSAKTPVIVDRYWHSTAAYAMATAVGGKVDNLPGCASELYRWPHDLLQPDLVVLLTVSPEERLRRLRNRGEEQTREEAQLAANHLFRNKVEEAYKRMKDPACVIVDASPSPAEVLQQVLHIIKLKLPPI